MPVMASNKLAGLLDATGLFTEVQIGNLLAERQQSGNTITETVLSLQLAEEEQFLKAFANAMADAALAVVIVLFLGAAIALFLPKNFSLPGSVKTSLKT